MLNLPNLNLPPADLKLRMSNSGDRQIYDPLRQKWVILTPEEYVRQSVVNFLKTRLHYPTALLANEVSISLNGMRRRCDTILFHVDGRTPQMIIEYKAPHISITQKVFDQILRYNLVLNAQWLLVTNGLDHYCCRLHYSPLQARFISEIPDYSAL